MEIYYLHGFNSAPKVNSAKVKSIQTRFPDARVYSPLLDYRDNNVFVNLKEIALRSNVRFVGTSLGGFVALYLSAVYGCTSYVFNPSINPSTSLKRYIGTNTNYVTNEVYEWTESHISKFEEIEVILDHTDIESYNTKVFCGTNDDVIPIEIARQYFIDAKLPIREYDDGHRFSKYFEKALFSII